MLRSKTNKAEGGYGYTSPLDKGTTLMLMMILGLFIMSPITNAADNWAVEGANGTLYVHGALTESPCRLDMASARQDIALGETGTVRLMRVGMRGEPVEFKLKLTDCLRTSTESLDVRTGSKAWADNQPAITINFRATRDADNPQLVKAHGVSGMGLRLLDSEGQDVRLGSRGKPLWLTPGQNTLFFSVMPERTPAKLVAGYYQATVDFQLSYE